MRKMILFVSVAVLALTLGTFTQAEPKNAKAAQDHTMKIVLTGGAEVPGPGDADGSGTANLTINHDKGEVCYDITVANIGTPTAAHIHEGAAGKAGGPKVTFKAVNGAWKGCVSADKALLDSIMKNPGGYYVNVHNSEFPGGALRGQLGK
jgi:hypothetical protein